VPRLRGFLFDAYRGLPATTWLVCGAAFVNRAGSMVLPFLSLYLGARFGFTVEQAGYFVSLYGVGATCGNLLGGRLVDPLGPVRVQIATLLGAAVWMWLMTLAGTPLLFGAGVLVLGLLNDAFRPGNMASVLATVPPELGPTALTLNRVAVNAGWAIGPTIGGQLAHIDYRLLFVADGTSCALAALVLLLWVPRRLQYEHAAPAAGGTAARDTAPAAAGTSPWRDVPFLWLLGTTMATFLAFMQYFSTETRYLKNAFGFDESKIGWLLAINPTLIVLVEMPLVRSLRGRPRLPIVAFGTLLIALAFPLLVPHAWGMGGLLAQLLLLTVGEMFSFSLLAGFVSDRAPPQSRGSYLGVYGATFSAAFVIAPSLGGFVYDRFSADALWYGCGVLAGLAALGYRLLHDVYRRQRLE
jgi:predicted MFS family arabinose efflux permease